MTDSGPARPDPAAAESGSEVAGELTGRGAVPPGGSERAVSERTVTQRAVTLLSSAERRALEAFLASAESEAGAPIRRP